MFLFCRPILICGESLHTHRLGREFHSIVADRAILVVNFSNLQLACILVRVHSHVIAKLADKLRLIWTHLHGGHWVYNFLPRNLSLGLQLIVIVQFFNADSFFVSLSL